MDEKKKLNSRLQINFVTVFFSHPTLFSSEWIESDRTSEKEMHLIKTPAPRSDSIRFS